jgi:hypothetical protein
MTGWHAGPGIRRKSAQFAGFRLALALHGTRRMTTALAGPLPSMLEVGFGLASRCTGPEAIARAAAIATSRLHGATPDLALIVTAGQPVGDAATHARSILGRIQIAGGATAAILTDDGPMKEGALVACVANADGAASGVAATAGRGLVDAGQAAARLILSGWPFRARYPRGLGIAFARPATGDTAQQFLDSWRDFMGPKMRTVCGVVTSPVLYGGPADRTPNVSVACVEAPYATGLGYTDAGTEPTPTSDSLVHGAADATLTALKRLDGRPAKLVLVIESAARYAMLGSATRAEWSAMRSQMDEATPCIGWLVDDVAAYGRGVQPTVARGPLVVVAVGDAPRA